MGMDHKKRRERRAALMSDLDKELPPSPPCPEAELGERVVEWALAEWEKGIKEPAKKTTEGPILGYIHAAGWGWIKDYQNRKFAWCGCFASAAWASVGLKSKVAAKNVVSTYRLSQWKGRQIPLDEIRAGDLVVIGSQKRWGDHITLAVEPLGGGSWATVEGNAWGRGPDGERFEGVIRRERSAREIRFAYRPLVSDLEK